METKQNLEKMVSRIEMMQQYAKRNYHNIVFST